jgi:hypothetical protein
MKPGMAQVLEFRLSYAVLAHGAKLTPVTGAYPEVFLPPKTEGEHRILTKTFQLSHPVKVLDYGEFNL